MKLKITFRLIDQTSLLHSLFCCLQSKINIFNFTSWKVIFVVIAVSLPISDFVVLCFRYNCNLSLPHKEGSPVRRTNTRMSNGIWVRTSPVTFVEQLKESQFFFVKKKFKRIKLSYMFDLVCIGDRCLLWWNHQQKEEHSCEFDKINYYENETYRQSVACFAWQKAWIPFFNALLWDP